MYMVILSFFFCHYTATTEIYTYGHTLSLHDALAISDEFIAILERDFSKAYDSSFVPTAEKDVWLKFTALNVDTFATGYYLYAKDAYYTVYLQADTGWHIQRNGYLLPLKERDNKKRTFFLPIQLKLSETTVIYIRLQAGNNKHSIDRKSTRLNSSH